MHKTPGPLEMLAGEYWVKSEIDAIEPAGRLAIGDTAARALPGRPWIDGIGVLLTSHPSLPPRGAPSKREGTFARRLEHLVPHRQT